MSPDKRAYSKSRPGSYLHAPRWTEQIMDGEACFQVMMLMRERPSLWRWLFIERNAGHSWREIRMQLRGSMKGDSE